MNNRNIGSMSPFITFCQKVIPLAYDESMSYYETLCALRDYVGQMISAVNNNADAVTELQNKFNELQNYVDNYFNNLDVQTEINNKLDEMAESGQLEDIIAQYLEIASILAFNTIADLKNATNLNNGSFTYCYGKNTYNDGYGAFYKIRESINTDVADDENLIVLTNYPNLIAEKTPNNNDLYVYPSNDETGNKDYLNIKNKLEKYNHVILASGTYYLFNSLNLKRGDIIEGNGEITKIYTNDNPFIEQSENDMSWIIVKNIYVENKGNTKNSNGINLQKTSTDDNFNGARYSLFENLWIFNFNNGINCEEIWSSKFNKIRIGSCNIGIKIGTTCNNLVFDTCQILNSSTNSVKIDPSNGVACNGIKFTNCDMSSSIVSSQNIYAIECTNLIIDNLYLENTPNLLYVNSCPNFIFRNSLIKNNSIETTNGCIVLLSNFVESYEFKNCNASIENINFHFNTNSNLSIIANNSGVNLSTNNIRIINDGTGIASLFNNTLIGNEIIKKERHDLIFDKNIQYSRDFIYPFNVELTPFERCYIQNITFTVLNSFTTTTNINLYARLYDINNEQIVQLGTLNLTNKQYNSGDTLKFTLTNPKYLIEKSYFLKIEPSNNPGVETSFNVDIQSFIGNYYTQIPKD